MDDHIVLMREGGDSQLIEMLQSVVISLIHVKCANDVSGKRSNLKLMYIEW